MQVLPTFHPDPVVPVGVSYKHFAMPSGNILCADDGHEALMTCLIKSTYLCGSQNIVESGLVGPITKSGTSWSALYINPSQVKTFADSGRTLPTPTPTRVHIAFA